MSVRLTANQARVIASLVEKSITTPQYYPLSSNALMAACNQKSARSPVMSLSEAEVGSALIAMENMRLTKRDDHGSRVQKWRHKFQHELLLKPDVMAVLVTLMLRGPQSLAEIRANAATLNGPADNDGVRVALDDLADRATPLAGAIPRRPGQSAQRFSQLICPETAVTTVEADDGESLPTATDKSPSSSALAQRVAALEARVQELEQRLAPLLD